MFDLYYLYFVILFKYAQLKLKQLQWNFSCINENENYSLSRADGHAKKRKLKL